ncbi:MAG: hypothetical protein ACRD2D_01905 [Terriglobales bacterium]
MAPVRTIHFWTWLGLTLLVVGSVLWLFPLLPVRAAGGTAMLHVPHWPEWETAGLAGLGLGVLIGARRKTS